MPLVKFRPKLNLRQALADELLEKARQEDMASLVKLDALGLLIGPDESAAQYADRLRALRKNLEQFEAEMRERGSMPLEEFTLQRKSRIREKVFHEAMSSTWGLYDFSIHWVPGYYTEMGARWIAGCALYSYEDFFAVFLLRRAFESKERWWIYGRNELMAHELCHIARIGFRSSAFEELFAYQTASVGFRRFIGGIVRSPRDMYSMAGGALSLVGAQYANVFVLGNSRPELFAIPALLFGFVGVRFLSAYAAFRRARRNLVHVFDSAEAMPVLFRCSDADVYQIARLGKADRLQAWIEQRAKESLRWRVTLARYRP